MLIATRQPANAVGWLLLLIGVCFALTSLVDSYVRSESAPALTAVAWLSHWVWFVWFTLAGIFLPLVFPTGRLLSRRWRPVLWLALCAAALSILGAAFQPGALDVESPKPIENPLGLSGAWADAVEVVSRAGDVLAGICFLLAAASLVIRFRRSRGIERQQLKWFALVGLVALGGLVMAMVQVLFGAQPGEDTQGGSLEVVGAVGWFTALGAIVLGIPAATGIAILRHRLYDIDVVLNRTLVYGALTLTLLASYAGVVLLRSAPGCATRSSWRH
jgi:hypothetical protein